MTRPRADHLRLSGCRGTCSQPADRIDEERTPCWWNAETLPWRLSPCVVLLASTKEVTPHVRQNRRRVVWQRVTWRMMGIYCMPCAREGWKQTLALMMSCQRRRRQSSRSGSGWLEIRKADRLRKRETSVAGVAARRARSSTSSDTIATALVHEYIAGRLHLLGPAYQRTRGEAGKPNSCCMAETSASPFLRVVAEQPIEHTVVPSIIDSRGAPRSPASRWAADLT
jgi:hypothetical protein